MIENEMVIGDKDLVKLGSEILYFIFGRKNGCFFVLFCCNFVQFWLTFLLLMQIYQEVL